MSKARNDEVVMGLQAISSKDFDDQRNIIVDKFSREGLCYKRKLTQSLYWTSLDKDLANQYWRDERWFLGIKFCDILKLIDHGADGVSNKGVGFIKK
jgi:hypothetical protein